MAITNNGTRVSISEDLLPADYVKPVVNDFKDAEYKRTLTLSIDKATVHNADPKVTMANIIANATVGINKQVADLVAADYLSTATVTTFADLIRLGTNMESVSRGSAAYTNAAPAFIATVVLHVKTA